jgi:hypothetical protein
MPSAKTVASSGVTEISRPEPLRVDGLDHDQPPDLVQVDPARLEQVEVVRV